MNSKDIITERSVVAASTLLICLSAWVVFYLLSSQARLVEQELIATHGYEVVKVDTLVAESILDKVEAKLDTLIKNETK